MNTQIIDVRPLTKEEPLYNVVNVVNVVKLILLPQKFPFIYIIG